MEQDPADAYAHANLGTALFQGGKAEEALEHYQKAVQLAPEEPVILYNLANTLRHLGRPREAIPLCRKALALKPPKVLAVAASLCLGDALKADGLLDEAADQYRFTVELDPRHGPAHYNLANTLRDMGEAGEAVEHYRLALQGQHDRALAVSIHVNWGSHLESQGDIAGAIERYRDALELDPSDPAAVFNLARALALLP